MTQVSNSNKNIKIIFLIFQWLKVLLWLDLNRFAYFHKINFK